MQRRTFFHWLSIALAAAYVAFLAIPGVGLLIEPLQKHARKGRRRRLIRLNDLDLNEPRKIVITDRRTDAWTRYPEGPIGSVWMIRRDGDKVDVFTVTCPHLGCPVEHLSAEKKFYCPCHEASYGEDGSMIEGPQQRGMDQLEVTMEDVKGEKWVSVVFERFELGTQEKISIG